jgi:2-polyprenyl-3-methyl-5-hydroxy-6-metoxy-1,4-benzoquinol methylase
MAPRFSRLRHAVERAGYFLREMRGSATDARYGIKPGYRHRKQRSYFEDVQGPVVYQPDVYRLAAHLGALGSARYLVDLGCGRAHKLLEVTAATAMQPVGIDFGDNLRHCRATRPDATWIEADLERPDVSLVGQDILGDAIVVCSDVIEHLEDPDGLVRLLREWMRAARICVLTTPERDLLHGPRHRGPPRNPHHLREWNAAELAGYLSGSGLNVLHVGLTRSSNAAPDMRTSLAIIGPTGACA